MKKTTLVRALVLASLAIAAKGYSQTPVVPGSVSKVNLALTLSDTVIGHKNSDDATITTTKDTAKAEIKTEHTFTKIVAAKYSTKELVADLAYAIKSVEDASGWSLEKIQITVDDEGTPDLADEEIYFLTKKDETTIVVGSKIDLEQTLKRSGRNLKTVTTTTTAAEPVVTAKTTYSEALKFAGTVKFNLVPLLVEEPGRTFSLSGVYTGSQKLGALKNAAKTPVILSGAAKISSLSGVTNDGKIVEGSMSFSAGVAADVSGYPGVLPAQEEPEQPVE